MTQNDRDILVCLVDDDDSFRESLRVLLDGSPGFACPAAFRRGDQALKDLPTFQPDVVLMDIKMPHMSGIECVRRLKQLLPETKVMMLTLYEDEDLLFQSLRAGAMGYVLKRTPPTQLLQSVQEIAGGAASLTGKMARLLIEHFQQDPDKEPLPEFSDREKQVLEHVSGGLRNKEIAAQLGISEHTVRSHLRNIYDKLQVDSRAQAVAKYMDR